MRLLVQLAIYACTLDWLKRTMNWMLCVGVLAATCLLQAACQKTSELTKRDFSRVVLVKIHVYA